MGHSPEQIICYTEQVSVDLKNKHPSKYLLGAQQTMLKMSNRRKIGNFSYIWKVNSIFSDIQWVNEEITSENGNYL